MRLNTTRIMPQGGYRYFVAETATWIPAQGHEAFVTFEQLQNEVRRHYRASSLQIPPQLDDMMQEFICHRLGPLASDFCNRAGIRVRSAAASRVFGFSLAEVEQGTASIVDWFLKAGGRRVDNTLIVARTNACAACPHNDSPVGCDGCGGGRLKDIISRVLAGHILPSDSKLRSCRICGCGLRVKTRVPLAVLLPHMPEEQLRALPEFCWIKTEQTANDDPEARPVA